MGMIMGVEQWLTGLGLLRIKRYRCAVCGRVWRLKKLNVVMGADGCLDHLECPRCNPGLAESVYRMYAAIFLLRCKRRVGASPKVFTFSSSRTRRKN